MMAVENKYAVNNIDVTIIAEEPKIFPFRERIVEAIAAMLGIDKRKVNIKATTNEGVGSLGKGDAIAAFAIAMLEEKR
jgi:2-C-methyl-D-erythritol 2,4-cyclodiphosphate synthase